MMFKPATKKAAKLRMALIGPAGSGKTYSALALAQGLGSRVAVIDTEHGSASLYADKFQFDTCTLESFSPDTYVEALKAAEAAGYDVIIIDSLSHAWIGKEGALEQVDNAARRSGSKNTYFAWRDVTPKHNNLVEAIIQSKAHIIATMRAKTEYTLDKDDKGKVMPRKIGMAPIQREGLEYEFSIAGDMDLEHNYNITKTRCSMLTGKVNPKPGAELAKTLRTWLEGGAEEIEEPKPVERPTFARESQPGEATVTELSPRERLRVNIRGAKTLEDLEKLIPELQKLPEPDRDVVRPDYGKRKAELSRGAA
jgi:hypothetical protein